MKYFFIVFIFLSSCEFNSSLEKKEIKISKDKEITPNTPIIPNNPFFDKSGLIKCEDFENVLGVNDPYSCFQWHLNANAQSIRDLSRSGFISSKPVIDINAGDTLKQYNGSGIRVHVSDGGLDADHEDLKENFILKDSRNYLESISDAFKPTLDNHGTACAGLIAAEGNNNIGGIGVAYNSTFSGDNIIVSYNSSLPQSAIQADSIKKSSDIDIRSASYGFSISNGNYVHMERDELEFENYKYSTTQNNIFHIKSSGNDGAIIGADGNTEAADSIVYVHNVAAANWDKEIAYYSTPGANLFITAPAGENRNLGTCTTNDNDAYTCRFSGTSAATPIAAGVGAVVLEALKENKPNARWIDLAWILAKTAKPNLISDRNVYNQNIGSQKKISRVTNGFGLTHSFDQGFGLIDLSAAVDFAKKYTGSIPDPELLENSEEFEKTLKEGTCEDVSFEINQDFQVWSAEVNIHMHDVNYGDIGIFLVMPDGKISMVKTSRASTSLDDGADNLEPESFFGVRAPMGINAKGIWKVRVCSRKDDGDFTSASLNIYGFNNLETLK